MKSASMCLIAAALLGGASPAGREPPAQLVFRAGTYAVTIDVSVRRRNAPVPGLTASDFELLDNGVKQKVEIEGNDAMPLDVSLVFDHTRRFHVAVGRGIASDLAKTAASLRPIDRFRAITFATNVREVFPMQALGATTSGVPQVEALTKVLTPEWPDVPALELPRHSELRRSSLLDALLFALATPAAPGRRHVVVCFSLGQDSASVLTDAPAFQAVAERTDALLHVWDARKRIDGNQMSEGLYGQYIRTAIDAAAFATGGGVHDGNPVGTLRSMLEDFRRSYRLQYTLTGVPPGGWHDVVVKVPRFPDFVVRARKGYAGQ